MYILEGALRTQLVSIPGISRNAVDAIVQLQTKDHPTTVLMSQLAKYVQILPVQSNDNRQQAIPVVSSPESKVDSKAKSKVKKAVDATTTIPEIGVNTKISSNSLQNKTMVFTGTLQGLTRELAEDHCVALGAKLGKSVNGKTNILVIGSDKRNSESVVNTVKYKAAIGKYKDTVEIWNEQKLLDFLKLNNKIPSDTGISSQNKQSQADTFQITSMSDNE